MARISWTASIFFASFLFTSQTLGDVVNLEDLTLAAESFDNGDPGGLGPGDSADGSFVSGGATFNNTFTNFGGGFTGWTGWSYSNVTDVTTPGFSNQYAAYHLPGGGGDNSSNFGVAFSDAAFLTLPTGQPIRSMRITNNTYAALSMRDGDAFAKQFGGPTGNDPDFFLLTITGRTGGSSGPIVGSIPFYLADYRFADNNFDFIIDRWTTVDLSTLSEADTLTFSFSSSDVGGFGINTPLYFAADNLLVGPVPEPSSLGSVTFLLLMAAAGRRQSSNFRGRLSPSYCEGAPTQTV